MLKQLKKNLEKYEGPYAAAGFALVLIIIGLPVWWWTTTVYRAALPYSNIDNLSSLKPFHTLHLTVVTSDPISFRATIDKLLISNDPYVKFSVRVRGLESNEEQIIHSSLDIEDLDQKLNELTVHHDASLCIYLIPKSSSLPLKHLIHVSRKRQIIMSETADLSLLSEVINGMARDSSVELDFHESLFSRNNGNKKLQIKRQVFTEPGYDIIITLMLPQPHRMMAKWDVESAINEYLNPFVEQLKNVAELRIRSQVLYMTAMKISPRWSSEHKHYSLPEQQLPLTINDIEAKLGSFVSTEPSLHFIVYVPNELQIPLRIHTKEGAPLKSNSFLVPRWGSIMIHNPSSDLLLNKKNQSLPLHLDIDSEWVMSTIVTHLHKLFPIPSMDGREDVVIIGSNFTNLLMDWQLDALARTRVLSYLNNIRITLQSLCDLVGEISNMVVSDDVANRVWASVMEWQHCLAASREGRLKEATTYCSEAFVYSDSAFFHPSMLALLYFPDNQKYAIYVPLFLPVCIPVVLSFRTILKLFRKSSKSKEE